jgi:hypothetical protein
MSVETQAVNIITSEIVRNLYILVSPDFSSTPICWIITEQSTGVGSNFSDSVVQGTLRRMSESTEF